MAEQALRELTPDELSAYETDGVFCARGLFSDAWIDRMANAVDRIVANPTLFGNVVSMRDQNFSGDLFVWKVDDDFRDWVYESPAARIAQQVLGSERICHFYDQLFVKPAGCQVPTPWHQDITFWPVDVECRSICSIWITFDPVDRAGSGLEFVKGSHRWTQRFKAVTPNYDPYMLASDFEDAPDIDNHREDYDLYCPDMGPGDCLIFNPHVMHGSSSNYSTDTARRAFSSRWSGEGVTYEDRYATMPLLWEHGLKTGDPVGGSLFPQILPHPIEAQGARRALGPEPPEPETVQAVMSAVAKRAPRS
ncbi:MAG: phytanoyl-CoA dioxygenase family protein [Myxococcota bacterium]